MNSSVLKRIAKEIEQLQKCPPEGVKIILNEGDLSDIQAFIQGPGKLLGDFKPVLLTIKELFISKLCWDLITHQDRRRDSSRQRSFTQTVS